MTINTMPYFLRKNVTTVEKKSKNAYAQGHIKRHCAKELELEEKSGEPQEMEISEETINYITWRILENIKDFLTDQLKEEVREEEEDYKKELALEEKLAEEGYENLFDIFYPPTRN